MATPGTCLNCGAPLTGDARQGFCPKCLFLQASAGTVRVRPPDEEEVGTVIGHFKLLEKVGEGGFGAVYVAEQREPVKRRVALKIIKLGMDTRQVVARFEAERQALALMDHPNIARVLDVGATETGRPYFVMELVRGMRITDYCDQNNLSTGQRLNLFIQVCHAIQHAHQKGIIHRDIKASNILVTVVDGQPVPKVIDFGIAKATQGQLTDKTVYTQLHQFIGTPAYMSPEQAALSGVDVDTRSDIYSLGVLLYELLTGHTPFDLRTLLAVGLDEMRRMIREKEPPRPSTRISTLDDAERTTVARHRQAEAATLRRLLRGDLDWIVMKCLEKDRARRYETANDFAEDIERHLEHQPVVAGPPSTVYRARKFIRRHRLGVGFAAVVVAALALGLVSSLIGFAQARHERDRSLAAEAQAAQLARQESEQRRRAEASAEATRREKEIAGANLRMAQINLIQQHLDNGEVGPALALLEEQRPTVNLQDSRSIEWRYLWRRAHQGHRFTLRGHEGTVYAVACFPNENRVVSGGADGTVRLWDMGTGRERATLARNQAAIRSLAVSPDGKTLAWGDNDGMLTVGDLAEGRRRATVRAHNAWVADLAFSPDSQLIATIAWDGTTRLWKAATGASAGAALPYGNTEPASEVWMDAVAFSTDGQTLACAEFGSIALWDLNTWKVRARLHRHRFLIANLAFSPDGRTLVSGGGDNMVKLWDVAAARPKAEFVPNIRLPSAMALSPDGTAIAVGGDCGTIEVTNLVSGATKTFGHIGRVMSVVFSPDGKTLVSAGEDGTVKLWDLAQEQNQPPLHHRQTLVWSVTYSPDGKMLACGGEPEAELWDAAAGHHLHTIPGADGTCAVFAPDGKVLVGHNWLWDVEAGRQLPSVPSGGGIAAAFSRDGQILALSTSDSAWRTDITLWDWKTREKRTAFGRHSSWISSLAVSPDGLTLASASGVDPGGGEVMLWEMPSGRRLRTLGHGCACVAFSPDGKTLATGSRSGGIALWNPDTGELLKDLAGHIRFMQELAFAPDGKTVASCNVQGSVTVWDVEKGIERATLTRRGHSVYSIGFSPDGLAFATGGREGTLEMWRTASAADVRAQSDCFDPKLRLARKQQAEARSLRLGLHPQDALGAYSQAEGFYAELAAEFPERTDYRYSRLANQIDLVSFAAQGTGPLEDTDRWLALAEKAVEVASRDTSQLSGLLRSALLNRLYLRQRLNRLSGAVTNRAYSQKLVEEVLTVAQRVLGPDHPETLRTMLDLAGVCRSQGNVEEAEALNEAALPGLRRVLGPDHPETLHVMQQLADAYQKEGKFSEAETALREVLAAQRKLPGRDHSQVVSSLYKLISLLELQANWTDALTLLREAAEGGDVRSMNNFAWLLATSADPTPIQAQSAINFAEKAVAATSRTNANYLDTLAAAYAGAGQFTNAVNVQKEAIAVLTTEQEPNDYTSRLKLYESNSPFRDDGLLANSATALLEMKKFAEAEPLARECLTIREKQIPDDWRTFNARSLLGGSLLGQKKYAEAEPLLVVGYEGMKQREPQIRTDVRAIRLKEALQRLAQLYQEIGQTNKAAACRQRLAEIEVPAGAK